MTVDPALLTAHVAAAHAPQKAVTVEWDGATWTDETAHVIGLTGVESTEEATLQADAGSVTLVLDNSTRRFDRENADSPIAPYLTHRGQRVRIDLGYDGHLVRFGTYRIDDITDNPDDRTVTLALLDRASDLMARNVTFGPLAATTGAVARTILVAAGLVEGTDFVVETGDLTCRFAMATDKPAWGELRALAFAEGGRVYVDTDGVVRFVSATTRKSELEAPVVSFSRSAMAYSVAKPQRRDLVNRVVLEYEDREASVADEIVFELKAPIVLPYGRSQLNRVPGHKLITIIRPDNKKEESVWVETVVSTTIQITYGQLDVRIAGMDMTRWERSIPVEFTTIDTFTATLPDGVTPLTLTATAPPVGNTDTGVLWYVWEPGTPIGRLHLWCGSLLGGKITALKVRGKPARSTSPYSLVVDDVIAQVDGIAERAITNPYLPTTDLADLRAREYLASLSGQRARLAPTIDGAPYLHVGSVFSLVDDTRTPAVTDNLVVIRSEWAFDEQNGFAMALTTAAAPPPSTTAMADSVPAPTDDSVTSADDSGPWNWGPDAHPIVWGYFQWG